MGVARSLNGTFFIIPLLSRQSNSSSTACFVAYGMDLGLRNVGLASARSFRLALNGVIASSSSAITAACFSTIGFHGLLTATLAMEAQLKQMCSSQLLPRRGGPGSCTTKSRRSLACPLYSTATSR